jgi:hypothetical protein
MLFDGALDWFNRRPPPSQSLSRVAQNAAAATQPRGLRSDREEDAALGFVFDVGPTHGQRDGQLGGKRFI